MGLLEQPDCERTMHADIEKPIIEWNGKDGWPPVLRDDRKTSALGVPQQFRGTLP